MVFRQSAPEGPRQHSAPPQHSGAPLPALRSISRAPTTDRGCLCAPARRTNSSCHVTMIIIDSTSVNGHELSRVSAGPSTAAARNHGGGGPTTCTTHDELVQVRVSRGRPSWLSHTAAAPPSWTWPIAPRERRARATAVGKVVGRSIERSDARGPFGPTPSLQETSYKDESIRR
jgi:hypothetical protein